MPGSFRLDLPTGEFDGYIFDCDGTLADTMPLHFRCWQHALSGAGAKFEFTWEVFTSRAGMSLEHTVAELNAQFRVSLDPMTIASKQREIYDAQIEAVAAIQPVVDLARTVSTTRQVSVASGSLRPHVLRTLHAIGVSGLFDIIVTPEDVRRGKPAPDMFLLAAERMGVESSRCLVIEDSPVGVRAARDAGMQAALVSRV